MGKYHEKMSAREGEGEIPPTEKLTYVGCYRKESQLPAEKVYGGGVVGASASAAFNHARSQKKRYVAVARVGDDGHAFAFDSLPSGAAVNDGGCARPCADDDAFACGRRRRLRRRRETFSRRGVCAKVGGLRRRRAEEAEEE